MAISPIQLIRQATPGQRRTLLAASMGWALDAFDAMLYALVLTLLMRDLGMTKAMAGLLGTLTLLASGLGGVLFGFLADRIGRKQALMASILTYSVCSFASGLATSIAMLAVARFVLGLGMGGGGPVCLDVRYLAHAAMLGLPTPGDPKARPPVTRRFPVCACLF